MGLQPIPTRYKGYHFRSRLEARWAVFFDAMGLKWEYEPEGFDIDGTMYLPDFRVVAGEIVFWYEVKPPGTTDCPKFSAFCKALNLARYDDDCWEPSPDGCGEVSVKKHDEEGLLVSGDPLSYFARQLKSGWICPRCANEVQPESFSGDPEIGFLCHPCDLVTASGGGNPTEIGFAGTKFYPCKGWIMTSTMDYEFMLAKINMAGNAARSARFEHGQTGAT